MKLYGAGFSGNTRKVKITAEELELPLELVEVDAFKGANRSPEYLAKNPMGKLPTLEDGDFVVFESAAICDYLASKKPGALAPLDARGRADMWRWLAWFGAHIQPWVATIVLEQRVKPSSGAIGDDAAARYSRKELARFLPVLENHLKGRAYVLDQYSIADICLGVGMQGAGAFAFKLDDYPTMAAWVRSLAGRPAWKKHPSVLPRRP